MKITTLEMANVKRIKALRLVPTENGLTIIGGKNGQGKTSVLDAIAYGLGGGKYRPTNLRREGAVGDTFIHIETDNGLVIDRKDGERSLRVRDEQGNSSGQKLLDRFISELAIDLPKFHNAPSKDKAKMLLHALGVDAEIAKLDADEKAKFDTRTVIGRQADQKEKAAKDMEWYEDAPAEPVSVKELIERQQAILARNGHRQECAARRDRNAKRLEEVMARMAELADERATLVAEIEKDEKAVAEAAKTNPGIAVPSPSKADKELWVAINRPPQPNHRSKPPPTVKAVPAISRNKNGFHKMTVFSFGTSTALGVSFRHIMRSPGRIWLLWIRRLLFHNQ